MSNSDDGRTVNPLALHGMREEEHMSEDASLHHCHPPVHSHSNSSLHQHSHGSMPTKNSAALHHQSHSLQQSHHHCSPAEDCGVELRSSMSAASAADLAGAPHRSRHTPQSNVLCHGASLGNDPAASSSDIEGFGSHHVMPQNSDCSDVGPTAGVDLSCLQHVDVPELRHRQQHTATASATPSPPSAAHSVLSSCVSARGPSSLTDEAGQSDAGPRHHHHHLHHHPHHDPVPQHHHMHHHHHHHATHFGGAGRSESLAGADAAAIAGGAMPATSSLSNVVLHHPHGQGSLSGLNGGGGISANAMETHTAQPPGFVVKSEIEHEVLGRLSSSSSAHVPLTSDLALSQKHLGQQPGLPGEANVDTGSPSLMGTGGSAANASNSGPSSLHHDPSAVAVMQQHLGHHPAVPAAAAAGMHQNVSQHVRHHHAAQASAPHHQQLMSQHPHHAMHHHHQLQQQRQQQQQHLFAGAELAAAVAAAAAAAGSDPRHHHHHLHYGSALAPGGPGVGATDCLTTQKAVAFLAGPRERIHVVGSLVNQCPRCHQEGNGATTWRPHRHIGELKIRYICTR